MGSFRGDTLNHLPDESLEQHDDNLFLFWYWIFERQKIWYKRFILKKPAPWTDDEILRDFKFTNVYRQLDRNSIWLIENVIRKDGIKFKDRIFRIILCRLFNNPETFEAIGIPELKTFNPKVFKVKVEKKIINKGLNPFTNAYLINSAAFPGLKRYEAYCLHISQQIVDNLDNICHVIKNAKKPDEILKALMNIHGISYFIAYEIYCDLDYGDNLMKFDQNDLTNVGPGAQGGVRLVFPQKGLTRKGSLEMIYFLRDNQDKYFKQFNMDFDKYKLKTNKYGGKLTLREIEHSLCEFQKYWKMMHDVGKPRMKFKAITEVQS